ncbi:uncharacterized protein KGF55_000597 [Candida pseudojiufengensis]|uniref:uncharacterized protein n=1 Tax=Candida pseudojiufengensis TaxID=497109 RepID=UPI0022243528|nr:uncharacterized protein KGF55_000597 [Candida pseudojiufengensis]KAI5966288.1 hypothetical protein KGF55_000597 [Candida pseudojiufengensis]
MSGSNIRQRKEKDTSKSNIQSSNSKNPLVRRLAYYHELDEWQQDNHYIKSGYVKGTSSYLESFKSLGYLHNETVNIYSHLIPSSISFWIILYYINFQLTQYENYLGIWEKLNFLQFGLACTFFCTIFTLHPEFSKNYYRPYRSTMFILFGLSGVLPVATGVYEFGFETTKQRCGIIWLILEGFFYILGAVLYAIRFPERTTHVEEDEQSLLDNPVAGKFDIFGHSHQIFHIFVVIAAFCHWKALVQCYHYLHQNILQ